MSNINPNSTAKEEEVEEELQYKYHHGFGNHFESTTTAYPAALPIGRNNPRLVPHGLYTEQLSGTAFTAPRHENRRTWLYRIVPSVVGTSCSFVPCSGSDGGRYSGSGSDGAAALALPETFGQANWTTDMKLDPNPMRWGATPLVFEQASSATTIRDDNEKSGNININFVQGIHTLLGSGDPTCKSGIGIYVYAFNSNMSHGSDSSAAAAIEDDVHLTNSDGDFLIVPQQCGLDIQTEMGKMIVVPGEICVIPRGVVFTVNILRVDTAAASDEDDTASLFARGYILEIFRGHFQLPELGPIGSNGLANARDFLHPKAQYESNEAIANKSCTIVNKFGQQLFRRKSPHSPYNVVAWHGNYLPFKYDLNRFCAVNSVTYDHLDPSIYTVLTAKGGDEDGTALADFVIFPPRIAATGEYLPTKDYC